MKEEEDDLRGKERESPDNVVLDVLKGNASFVNVMSATSAGACKSYYNDKQTYSSTLDKLRETTRRSRKRPVSSVAKSTYSHVYTIVYRVILNKCVKF